MMPDPPHVTDMAGRDVGTLYPLSLTLDPLARFLNVELADDPIYDGLELQWFDDEAHGTGMLAFLSRRVDRRVGYYPQPGLRVDRAAYEIGGGTGSWTETEFEAARLEVAEDGVDATTTVPCPWSVPGGVSSTRQTAHGSRRSPPSRPATRRGSPSTLRLPTWAPCPTTRSRRAAGMSPSTACG